jgi:hypothetical protein
LEEVMLTSVSPAERVENFAASTNPGREGQSGSLLERMLSAWARSFELMADSKVRFPLDI